MLNTNLINLGYLAAMIFIVVSLGIGITILSNDYEKSRGLLIASWVGSLVGVTFLCICTSYTALGTPWQGAPSVGKYQVYSVRQGYMGLKLKQPDGIKLSYEFDPRTIDYVEVMPNDPRANTADVIGLKGHRRIIVYVIKEVEIKPAEPSPNQTPSKPKP